MKLSRSVVFLVAAFTLFSVAACSGGGTIATQPQQVSQRPAQPQPPGVTLQSQVIALAPKGGTYALKLPSGYSGSLTFGPNRAPAGTKMEIGLAAGLSSERSGTRPFITAPPADPFPIVFTLQLPITLTLPIPAFTITFPLRLHVAPGTFDISLFDPTHAISYVAPTNPTLLGEATISGHTLTFVPAVQSFTFVGGVRYSETISRELGGSGVVLPLAAGANDQALPPNGTLGGSDVQTTATTSGFLQWTVIPFGPPITFSPVIGDGTTGQGVESLIALSTATTTLTGTKISMTFNSGGSTPSPAGPNAFTPDATPTVLGPFDATCTSGSNCSFTVTDSVPLTPGKKFAFELLTVTVCVPFDVFSPCDANNPTNAQTQLNGDQQYDVLVSDSSGLLTNNYSVAVTGSNLNGTPLTSGTPCSFVPEDVDNGDHPTGYNDTWPLGPNTEFELFTGSPPSGGAACTFVVSYNGNPVASQNISIAAPSLSVAMKRAIMHRLFVNPPVNGPKGAGLSGH